MLSFANLVVAATVVGIATAAPEPVVLVKHVDVYVCPSVENIVPFDANYGSGIIPSGIETCLGSQLGPTFLNPFYNGTAPGAGVGFCFGQCLLTVAKELPCIAKAIATENPAALLGCGLTKADICACLKCLPDFAYKFVKPWCESTAGDGIAATNEYSDDNFIATADNSTKALLGLLTVSELQALRAENAAANVGTSPNNGTLLGGEAPNCIGSQCGDCCCIGPCLFGACVGICA